MNREADPARKPRPLLLIVSVVHLISLLCVWFLAEYVAERWWLTTLISYAPSLITLPLAILLLVLSLIRRNRAASVVNAIAFLLWFPFAGLHMNLPSDKPGTKPLRVLTFNIYMGNGGTTRIIDTIRRADADIVVLEEARGIGDRPDPLPPIEKAFPNYSFHRSAEVAVGTRLPVRLARSFSMAAGNRRRGVIIETEWQGRRISVVGVHLATAATGSSLMQNRDGIPQYLTETAAIRREQVRVLRQEIPKNTPVLLCGDFNTPPRGLVYRALTQTYRDAFAERGAGFGWTYPAKSPLLRIDYVFAGGGFEPVSAQVQPSGASDHLPLLAEVTL